MAYRSITQKTKPTAPELPEPGAAALVATSTDVPHAALHSLDTLLASGGRVMFHTGLMGANEFVIPNGDDPEGASPIYPNSTTWRVVARGRGIPITPGSFPWLEVVALPSGPMQAPPVLSAYLKDGAGGDIELVVTYNNGDAQTTTVTAAISIEASQVYHQGEPPAPYFSLVIREASAAPNTQVQLSAAWWHRWTRGEDVTCDWVLRYRGSPRVIDLAVVERPLLLVADTTDSRWPSAMYGNGQPLQQLPGEYPIQQIASADPALGTASIRRALYAHGRLLGPCLAWWSSDTEHVSALSAWISYHSGTGDDEAPAWTMTGTTPTLLGSDSLTTVSDNNFGWRLGHYARQAGHGDDFLDGRTGVLPVWVSAYVKTSAGTATISVRTDEVGWSEIVLEATNTDWDFVRVPGWLEVGTGPEDAPVLRAWVSNSGANTVSVRSLRVDFRQD